MMHAVKASVIMAVSDVSEFKVNFKVVRFLKVFLYHIVHFTLGPLCVIPIVIFDSAGLAKNSGFWPSKEQTRVVIIQYLVWLCCTYQYVTWLLRYFISGDDNVDGNEYWIPGIYNEQFYFFCLHLVIRSFIIAVRYGFCSELRYLLLSSKQQEISFVNKDLLGAGWLSFDPLEGLNQEISSSLLRNYVEEEYFKMHFVERLDERTSDRYSNVNHYVQCKESGRPFDGKRRAKEI